jgi:hypothetical protein
MFFQATAALLSECRRGDLISAHGSRRPPVGDLSLRTIGRPAARAKTRSFVKRDN